MTAEIVDGSDVDANGPVDVLATDESGITSDTAAVSFSAALSSSVAVSISVSVPVAENFVSSAVAANVLGSEVEGTVITVDALRDATIDAFGAAVSFSLGGSGSIAITGAGAGAKARNEIGGGAGARFREHRERDRRRRDGRGGRQLLD